MTKPTQLLLALCLVGFVSTSATGAAQDAPSDAAAHTESTGEHNPEDDLRLQLTAGSALAYGNARNLAVNLGGSFALRDGAHAFVVEAGWVFGMTSVRRDPDMMDYAFGDFAETANNLSGRLRYDFFADDDNAIFGVLRGRRDPFANLDPRLQVQAGYMRNLLREENHRFWVELGVDFSYDRFASGNVDLGGGVTSDDRSLFAARGFVGYSNELNSALTWKSGLEVLWVVARTPAPMDAGHFRFEWLNQFRSTVEDWFQLSLDITARIDSQPPGQESPWQENAMGQPTQMFDLLTTLNLVGNFDLDGEAAAEEEEADCPACPEVEPCPVGDEASETGAESEAESETEAEAESESEAESEAETASEAEAEPEVDVASGAGAAETSDGGDASGAEPASGASE